MIAKLLICILSIKYSCGQYSIPTSNVSSSATRGITNNSITASRTSTTTTTIITSATTKSSTVTTSTTTNTTTLFTKAASTTSTASSTRTTSGTKTTSSTVVTTTVFSPKCYICGDSQFGFPSPCDDNQKLYDCSSIDPSYDQCITMSYSLGNLVHLVKFCGSRFAESQLDYYNLIVKYPSPEGYIYNAYVYGFFQLQTCSWDFCNSYPIMTTTLSTSTTTLTTNPSELNLNRKCYICADKPYPNTDWSCDYTQRAFECSRIDPAYSQCITAKRYNSGTGSYIRYKFCGKGYRTDYQYFSNLDVKYIDRWGNVATTSLASNSYYGISACNYDYCNSEETTSTTVGSTTTEWVTEIESKFCYVCGDPQYPYTSWTCDNNQKYFDCRKINPSFDQCVTATRYNYQTARRDTFKFCGQGYYSGNSQYFSNLTIIYTDDWYYKYSISYFSSYFDINVCYSDYCNYDNYLTTAQYTTSTSEYPTTTSQTPVSTNPLEDEEDENYRVVNNGLKTMNKFFNLLQSMFGLLRTSDKKDH